VLLLRRLDERIGLSRAAAAVLSDPRDAARITHSLRDLLAQRIYGLCCGYEDLNDHADSRCWMAEDPDLLSSTKGLTTSGSASARATGRLPVALRHRAMSLTRGVFQG
jgi:Transposase DDE domain group 1